MKTPSVAVFDLGKVLVDFDYSIAARILGKLSKIPPAELEFLLCQSPLLCRFERGEITTSQFHRSVCETAGFEMGEETFAKSFGDIFSEIESMTALHRTFRGARIPTWIFSNTNEIAIRHIRNRFPFFANFDGYVLSYEHGAMKPTAKIYEVVERLTERSGSEILYMDDRAENVEAGLQRGWQAVLHETPKKTRARVAALGLPIGDCDSAKNIAERTRRRDADESDRDGRAPRE